MPFALSLQTAVSNAVKSWHTLSLTLAPSDDLPSTGPAAVVAINDMPELSGLRIKSQNPLNAVHVVGCPRLSALALIHDEAQRPGAALHLGDLPALRDVYLDGAFRQLAGQTEFGQLERLVIYGAVASDAVQTISRCQSLESLDLKIADVMGDPLTFLDAMPALDQCLVLGCPRVGRVRLTKRAGVRRFYFKYGRLDELEIDGAPNLKAFYLGHEAFGYNDHDARLPKLDIGRLALRNVPNLLYLMVGAKESKLPFTEIALADCPALRSLTLRAPPSELQPVKCRLTTDGRFSQLVQRRLFHLTTDRQSLARLNDSQLFRGGDIEDVQIEPTDAK